MPATSIVTRAGDYFVNEDCFLKILSRIEINGSNAEIITIFS